MLDNFIFYLTAIIAGVAVSIVISVVRANRKSGTVETTKSGEVDLERIEKYILPNNLGTPVDEVVKRMKTKQRVIPFRVDFTERRGTGDP